MADGSVQKRIEEWVRDGWQTDSASDSRANGYALHWGIEYSFDAVQR